MFDNLNIINTITIGWKNYYELAEPFIPHHHHYTASIVKTPSQIQSQELENLIKPLSGKKYNFIVTKHHLSWKVFAKSADIL